MFRCIALSAVLLLILTSIPGFAQEEGGQSSGFRDLISQIAIARSSIISFDVEVEGEITKRRALTADEDRPLLWYDLRIAYEQPDGRIHIARRDVHADLNELRVDGEGGENWQFLVETPEWRLIRRPPHGAFLTPSGHRIGGSVECFDPRSLGLAFCGDVKLGWGIEKVIGNYLQWPDTGYQVDDLGEGIVRYQKPDGSYRLTVDALRDYWPTEVVVRSGDQILSATKVRLVKVDDHWVPGSATLICPQATTELKFKWKSVNRPVAENCFRPFAIANSNGFKVSDLREQAASRPK